MKFGIVITSRAGSTRIPEKCFRLINGKPLLNHLLERCLKTELEVALAVPLRDAHAFRKYESNDGAHLYYGHDEDPMARLHAAAIAMNLDAVIRVCHDKVFITPELIWRACRFFELKNLDYLYSSQFTAGSGFEVISTQALALAVAKYKGVEHVSYAIKNVTANSLDMDIPDEYRSPYRFLVDYPEDLTLLETIFASVGQDCSLYQAIEFMKVHPWAQRLNQLPKLTVYTCAYNAEAWIEKAMGSVFEQAGYREMEYILVDDHSTDRTPLLMAKAAAQHPNVKFIRNPQNLGLASSSNVALQAARGPFIVRLDADDYFVGRTALMSLLDEITASGRDAIYPNNYFGSLKKIQNGKEQRHIGGAIFRRSAINHVKFTELLRGYDGLDFFLRAKDQLNIGYYGLPTFFYRQRKGSMSKTNQAERAKLKAEIEGRHGATA
jgi:spore coat polysaccharide biosynthesis protein SpsF (cytidylyltransferase family)